MDIEVGDVVLCTVERIENTVVFVKIENLGKETDGSIVMSEIAPGRIRNIRDYVVPKKKIVCKVLRISGDRIDLSLRRVSQKERKEVLERCSEERSYISILKSILGDKTPEILKEIQKNKTIYDFFEEAKKNPTQFEGIINKKEAEKILDILRNQKKKKAILKKEFMLKSANPNGITLIKEILGDIKDAEIKYISAGKFIIKAESEDLKKTDNKIQNILKTISEKAKKDNVQFSVK